VEKKEVELYEHQMDVVGSGKKRLACFGGVGSGKSFAMMLRLVKHALAFPGTTVLIVRRVKEDLRKTSLADFSESFGEWIEEMNMQTMMATLVNGTKVFFLHGWDDERGTKHLDAYNTSAFLISQAEELPEQTYRKLVDRNRKKTCSSGEITEHLELMEGNPAGRNWVWDLFCKSAEESEHEEEVRNEIKKYWRYDKKDSLLCRIQSADYSFVPEGYLGTLLENSSQRYIDRYVKGEFESYSGVVYDEFDERVHLYDGFVFKDKLPGEYRRVIAIDWGLRNPTAVLWAVYDVKEDVYFFYRESYCGGKLAQEQAEMIVKMSGNEKIDFMVMDPSAWNTDPLSGSSIAGEFQKIFQKKGWVIYKADNNRDRGLEAVHRQMKVTGGLTRLYVERKLDNFQKEIRDYRFPEDVESKEPKQNLKEDALKKNDHLMDAMRYLVMAKPWYLKSHEGMVAVVRE
jgi:PBSX family phage terminase large subunit